ncbi:hypothetical protein [Nonomuraea pusilla]|uniref:hypothetical protein n=1 Tax=Nonomuraea pusilla TaxID=46177 RepID=UPI0011609CED|nr:hypothetical protein [Nonomuraea pusilla]
MSWIVVRMVTTTCVETLKIVLSRRTVRQCPGRKADSTLLVVHRPDPLEQSVPPTTAPLFLGPEVAAMAGHIRACELCGDDPEITQG